MIDFPRHGGSQRTPPQGGADALGLRRTARLIGFDYIQMRIASPGEIRDWSHGEIVKPETINYRSYKPEHDALFCERIFGPSRDWECHCGKFKRIRYRGRICDRCGVEVTLSRVRRERMGHIELAVPIVHLWFFKALPSPLGNLLDMTLKNLERVIYYSDYVVVNPGRQKVAYMELLDDDALYDLQVNARNAGDEEFRAETGAEAVRILLKQLDGPKRAIRYRNSDGKGIDRLAKSLREEIENETSQHRRRKKLKRLKVVEAIRNSGSSPDQRNKPEWLVMDVIPVIPPDLRPLVPLDGGRFATSDLNDLYRRVINRNNRLKKLMGMGAPEVILRNEKRMLQESVDALFDNGRRGKAIKGRGSRPLKSLSDMLKGKQGRFRQNLLGKRVDYSGRSVIVVGPELGLHQCGLPKTMAVELFKPFIIHELERRGEAETVKRAKKIVEDQHPKVYEVLEDIISDHPVLLNRAPTLHRLSIQAFEPVLVEGKAIRLHPLVCAAFNADFDGDQMAVHVPLSYEAQVEARVLMLSANNLLLPANGRPITTPSQDMVVGSYYLTNPGKRIADLEGTGGLVNSEQGAAPVRFGRSDNTVDEVPEQLADIYKNAKRFASYAEVEMALVEGHVEHITPIWYLFRHPIGEEAGTFTWFMTTVGRVLFNAIVPDELGFQNTTFGKKELTNVIYDVLLKSEHERTTAFLDELKELGFRYATMGGVSIGITDLEVPKEKVGILKEADQRVGRFQRAYDAGFVSDGERYNKVIDTWTHANNDLGEQMARDQEESRDGFNPVHMMRKSGARGNLDQMRQLAGMRGLMAKPQKKLTGGMGEIIETPIRSNFREGLTVVEYFLSTHGARKGLADTALKTADAGYLTRRLVDVAQDVTVSEDDCGTVLGIETEAYKDGEEIIDSLAERITGSVVAGDPEREDDYSVTDPFSGEILLRPGELISEEKAEQVQAAGIEKVTVRSVLTCDAAKGVCSECYGRNLATMEQIDLGEAVGIIAAQSIGEPGTQLTLRTFHIGGTAARIGEQPDQAARQEGTVRLSNARFLPEQEDQDEKVVLSNDSELLVTSLSAEIPVTEGTEVAVEDGDTVAPGGPVYRVKVKVDGRVRRLGEEEESESVLIEGEDGRQEIPIPAGTRPAVKDGAKIKAGTMIDLCHRKTKPAVVFYDGGRIRVELREESYPLPYGATVHVAHGQEVRAGQLLYRWDPYHRLFIAEKKGVLKLFHVEEGKTVRKDIDRATLREQRTIIRHRPPPAPRDEILYHEVAEKDHLTLHPVIYTVADEALDEVTVPPGAELLAADGQEVEAGYAVAEVRGVAQIEGKVDFRYLNAVTRSTDGLCVALNALKTKAREATVVVRSESNAETVEEHRVPEGATMLVENGQQVAPGDRLYRWNPEKAPLLAREDGIVRLEGVEDLRTDGAGILKITSKTKAAESGSRSQKVTVVALDEDGEVVRTISSFTLRYGDGLVVKEGDKVETGATLAFTINKKLKPYRSRMNGLVEFGSYDDAGGFTHDPDAVETVKNAGAAEDRSTVVAPGGCLRIVPAEGEAAEPSTGVEVVRLPLGSIVRVEDGTEVKRAETLFETDPFANPVVVREGGVLDIEETRIVVRPKVGELHPPERSLLDGKVMDREKVEAGQVLARFSREEFKTRDITGGLPRVTELFEGRRPKDPAVITRIDGRVEFGEIKRNKREVIVWSEMGHSETYQVPVGKHLRVQQGDWVKEGDRLSEGSIDPHDLLKLSNGRRRVQEYILREVLDVYRLQGVKINEKHIAVIVRQMLRRVKVNDPGETELLEGDSYDLTRIREVNRRVREQARAEERKPRPAVTEPLLLGITKAALTTDSFISSASFQETTKVLTNAALRGDRDILKGLKENIIIGQLVPAGTGMHKDEEVEFLVSQDLYDEDIEPLFDGMADDPMALFDAATDRTDEALEIVEGEASKEVLSI